MIFHVITNFEEVGGAEATLIKLLNSYKTSSVMVFSMKSVSPGILNIITNQNITYQSLNISSFRSLTYGCFKFICALHKKKPTHIYSWMYHANFFVSIAKIFSFQKAKVIWGVRHSLDDFQGEKTSIKILVYLGRFLNFTTYKVIYCSYSSLKQHIKYRYSSKASSIFVPNGYNFAVFNYKKLRSNLVIGYAGRFHEAKDLSTLFRTVNILLSKGIPCRLKICGRGITKDNATLLRLIDNSGLSLNNITFLGEVADMSSFYSSLDIFILSSKTEGFPNVLVEAIGESKPVFSTDVGDAKTIINNSNHICPVGNADMLASNIIKFIDTPEDNRYSAVKNMHEHVSDSYSMTNFIGIYRNI